MTLTISVDLLTGSFDAGDADDRRNVEWPPHPARLFCALVSAARSEIERDALRWLEVQPPPLIRAARQFTSSQSSSYVVTNDVSPSGGSQTHPGRSNQLTSRSRAFPASPHVDMHWVDAEPDDRTRQCLDAVCRRVPYLGRSTGLATLAVGATLAGDDLPPRAVDRQFGGTAAQPVEDPTEVFEPCDQLDGDLMVRVPYDGYLARLGAMHEAGEPAWQASLYVAYRRQRLVDLSRHAELVVEPSVYRDVVALRFVGLRAEGRLAARFTEALRRAVLVAAGPTAPTALHGHGADGRPHVAFLALPHVGTAALTGADSERNAGARNADGHLLGLAVAVPDLPEPERRAVLAAVLGLRRPGVSGREDTVDLRIPGMGSVELHYDPGLVRPWGATPDRWRRGSRRWVTATPVLLDRYPKTPDQVEAIIRASVRQVGLPDPVLVEFSTAPMAPGAAPMRPVDLPRKYAGRLFRHVELTFDRKVVGPVLVGAGRYLGVGLFAPVEPLSWEGHHRRELAVAGRPLDGLR
jgi:CRISPR-associated protein Csb2